MDEPASEKRPEPKPTRLEEARRLIEEYAAELREIIHRLRRKMNYSSRASFNPANADFRFGPLLPRPTAEDMSAVRGRPDLT